MSEEPRKRSRFDQTEPEPKRASTFDRRSRSPSGRKSETRRSRSPVARSSMTPETAKKDPAAAAAAAAAKINASLEAKRGVQHVEVPPIRSTSAAGIKSPNSVSNVNGDIYQQDGDYIKDIEVNDLRNRYTLTKGATQKMIKDETGADVTTRGNYYPDKSMATPTNPPLYLHVTSQTKEGLEKAVAKIEELMQQELPNLVDERRFRRPREPEPFERDEQGRASLLFTTGKNAHLLTLYQRKWPEERIPIDLEPIPGFNLRAQVVGHGGAYVKHIQSETRCRVQIKGRGSGFIETATGVEADEPMYLHVAGPDPNEVKHARELCEDLLGNVKQQYQQFKERGGQRGGYGGGGRGGDRGGDHYGGGGRDGGDHYNGRGGGGYDRHDGYSGGHGQQGGYGGQQGGYGAQQGGYGSPAVAHGDYGAAAAAPSAGADQANPMANMTYEQAMAYAAQYAQYFAQQPGGDPYAAYGGYEAYVRMYYQYYAQGGQGAQGQGADQYGTPGPYGQQPAAQPGAPGAPGPGDQAPPPPPSSGEGPPPPPGSSGGGYSSVPPPPGM